MFGGVGTFSHNLAHALADSGASVTVMAGWPRTEKNIEPVDKGVAGDNPQIVRVPVLGVPPRHLWYQISNLSAARELFSKCDIIHGQDAESFPMIAYCKRTRPKLPWVVTIHANPLLESYYALRSMIALEGSLSEFLAHVVGFPFWDFPLRGDARYADAIVPVSESLSMEIQKYYRINPRKMFTIPTGVNIAHLEEIARTARLHCVGDDTVKIFYAGRLYWRKGIVHLLKSLAYLVNKFQFSDFQLQVFGRGPLEQKIRELVSRLDLSDNVTIKGFVPYRQLITSMAASDIVCFPSIYEACPLGMIEAMILERPLVVFDKPFSRELLGHNSELPLATSTEDYSRCLYSLCTSKDLRKKIGTHLGAGAREKFDINAVAARYLKLYKNLLH